jgi:hypothetical protein
VAVITDSDPPGAYWFGADALYEHVRELDQLVLLPGNPRQGDVGAISQSLERFGQLKPIVVNDEGVILAGNHTYLAAKALGWTHVAAVVGGLEGAEQSAFALADNRLSDLATYDNELLYEMASHVETETGSMAGIGYDDSDLEDLRREVEEPFHSGDERYTPEWVFAGMGVEFDVDLAAPPGGIDYIPAERFYTKDDDALSQDWTGEFAWCNPPFSIAADFGRKWLAEVTDGVWLGPMSHATEYRVDLMVSAVNIWLPNKLEFVFASGLEEGIGFPVFLAGFGDGGEALAALHQNEPDRGVLLTVV